jgi:hypothetical protein
VNAATFNVFIRKCGHRKLILFRHVNAAIPLFLDAAAINNSAYCCLREMVSKLK